MCVRLFVEREMSYRGLVSVSRATIKSGWIAVVSSILLGVQTRYAKVYLEAYLVLFHWAPPASRTALLAEKFAMNCFGRQILLPLEHTHVGDNFVTVVLFRLKLPGRFFSRTMCPVCFPGSSHARN